MSRTKKQPPVAASSNDEVLSLREVQAHIVKRGFSTYHIGRMVEAVVRTLLQNWGIKDRELLTIKRSDLDQFLDNCKAARTN